MSNQRFRRHRPLFTKSVPKSIEEPKIKWRVWPIMRMAVKRTCLVLGAGVLISLIIGVILTARFSGNAAPPALPDKMVLFLELEGGFNDQAPPPSFAEPFKAPMPTVRQIVDAIDAAILDPRVRGIVARMQSGGFSLAHTQEIRNAIKRFKNSDKFAYIYAQSYGGAGAGLSGGLGRYYLASVFDEIWMQPLGVVSIPGIAPEMPFFRSVLNKIGVEPQFFKRKDYKTAYENMTDTEISPQNTEMVGRIVQDLRAQLVRDISADRAMAPETFEALVDKGLLTADEALEAKLITHMQYADVLVDRLMTRIHGRADVDKETFVGVGAYAVEQASKVHGRGLIRAGKPKVALVYALGAIMPSRVGRGRIAAADEIAPAILDAADDKDVQSIVLRIDSPGGSPSASESILRAVQRAKQKGKRVVVSMGPMAASGGYWIAAYADEIFVAPTTLTGSIGVVGGKFVMQDLWQKIGVNWDGIGAQGWGKNAGLWSPNAPFTDSQSERFNAMLDHVYESFVTRVAQGREMSREDVEAIAGGRVWTGARAVNIGLADQIGGLSDALNYTALELGLEDRTKLDVTVYPAPKTPVEQLISLLGGQVALGDVLRNLTHIMTEIQPLMQEIEMRRAPAEFSVYESLAIE